MGLRHTSDEKDKGGHSGDLGMTADTATGSFQTVGLANGPTFFLAPQIANPEMGPDDLEDRHGLRSLGERPPLCVREHRFQGRRLQPRQPGEARRAPGGVQPGNGDGSRRRLEDESRRPANAAESRCFRVRLQGPSARPDLYQRSGNDHQPDRQCLRCVRLGAQNWRPKCCSANPAVESSPSAT